MQLRFLFFLLRMFASLISHNEKEDHTKTSHGHGYMRVGSFMLDSLVGICLQEFFMGFLAAQSF